ncbi:MULTISPECIES: hypothetical protein [Sediminimonas]|uniref:hypothetical protein n=1 Tax=Sediminimonas TaxID=659427 RepID=UPI000425BFE9|nr:MULTISPECIES: hypothetical protein [Sediminimonas]MDR9485402.1 hypothetical protein [Sediminimonas sp.]
MTRGGGIAAAWLLFAAQGALAQEPLSAIDWLSEHSAPPITQRDLDRSFERGAHPGVQSVQPPDIEVLPLEVTVEADAVGLVSSRVSGLPSDLWAGSDSGTLISLLRERRVARLPAMQRLLYTLLLAEAEPPKQNGNANEFLQGRVEKLMDLGALDPALALLDRAGPERPGLFDLWFDAALLTGQEDTVCQALRARPTLTQSQATRIFCMARGGQWADAALLLDTSAALGLLSEDEEDLLAWFLEPELFHGVEPPPPPQNPTALVFRLREAVGEPLPTTSLPRAFAVSDLRGTAGWKAQLTAAERLARTGALPENRLLGIYTARQPAASGGIWDRVEALQAFDEAMRRRDAEAIAETLPVVWIAMQSAELEVPFAALFASRLSRIPLTGSAAALAYEIALLGPEYEAAARTTGIKQAELAFVNGLARGSPALPQATGQLERAIAKGFSAAATPKGVQEATRDSRLGEVILTAMRQYEQGVQGNLTRISQSLATFRAVGLEDIARSAALQLLLLRPRL